MLSNYWEKNARRHLGKTIAGAVFLLFCCAQWAYGTIYNSNGSSSDVQAKVNLATDGDTVTIPAGSFTWTSTVTNTKALTISGAGVGSTNITRGPSFNSAALFVQNTAAKVSTISGITWIDSATGYNFGLVSVSGTSYRLYNCDFTNLHQTGVMITGQATGLVDHCNFVAVGGNSTGIFVHPFDRDLPTTQRRWAHAVDFGSSDWAFIEDCDFNFKSSGIGNGIVDAYDGAKLVFRHNTVENSYFGGHGADSGYPYDSVYAVEVYNNTYTSTINLPYVMQSRGGAGLYHDNTATISGGTPGITLEAYRSSDPNLGIYGLRGPCDGKSSYDGNQDSFGYPCCEQPGFTGPASFYSDGTGSTVVKFGHTETSSPVYAWSNTANGGAMAIGASAPNVIHLGRDYFSNTAKPGYTPYIYPHPLQGGEGTPPTAPEGLAVVP